MNSGFPAARSRRRHFSALLAVALVSTTLPRIGFLKFTEFFCLLGAPRIKPSIELQSVLVRCFGPFFLASLFSFAVAILMSGLGTGDNSLSSGKAIYSNPALVPVISLLRIIVYLACIATITSFFIAGDPSETRKALTLAYYFTVLPGLSQIFRIYSGIHFDLPFERPEVGPFRGVFDAGYLRVMGFEFEPLAYATSLVAISCIYVHHRRRFPWLGIVVLFHTYGAGAIGGLLLALLVSRWRTLVRWLVPVYAAVSIVLFWYVHAEFDALAENFFYFQSVMERLTAINACVKIFLDYPLGVGLGLYGYFFNFYNEIGFFQATSLDHYPNNDLAMFLAYGGIVYAGAYLYVFHFLLRKCRSYWLRIALIALLIQSFTSYLFFNPSLILVASLILAGSSFAPARSTVHPDRRRGHAGTGRFRPAVRAPVLPGMPAMSRSGADT